MNIAYAAGFDTIISNVTSWISMLIPIVFALCLLVFLWGLVIFISKSGDETAREEGKQRMLWGIIALFVAVSIWGITSFIGTSLGIDEGNTPSAPGIPGAGAGTQFKYGVGSNRVGPPQQ